MKTARYFKLTRKPNGDNYYIVRKLRNGKLVRDQLPHEGLYTPYEISMIVDGDKLPGYWADYSPLHVGYIFGLRQYIGVPEEA